MNATLQPCSAAIRTCLVLAAALLVMGSPVNAQEGMQPQSAEQPSGPATVPIQAPSESEDPQPASSSRRSEITHIGSDSVLGPGGTAGSLVAIGGSAISEGDVSEAVVAISGDARARGRVGGEVVAVLGSVNVDGTVGGDVVAVFGNVELGPQAKIGGDVVTVGGRLLRDPAAVVSGDIQEVSLPAAIGQLDWLRPWLQHALLYGRPLALETSLSWAWVLAISLLAVYVLLTVLFPRASERCVTTLETQPGNSLLTALLSVLLVPFLLMLLVISVIGIAALPILGAALVALGFLGKATVLAAVGRLVIGRASGPFNHIAVAVLVGGLIVLALYVVPVAGFIVQALTGLLGFGAVIYTLILGIREKHRRQPTADTGNLIIHTEGPTMQTDTATSPGSPSASISAANATSLPRAGFGLRMAALLVDVLLVGVVVSAANILLVPLAIYGAIMWRLKGATVGDIVFGLEVVRLDGSPIDWATAIVRALGCFLSLFALGLGFFWILFDSERQAWHDKIAGTVVCVRKGISLT